MVLVLNVLNDKLHKSSLYLILYNNKEFMRHFSPATYKLCIQQATRGRRSNPDPLVHGLTNRTTANGIIWNEFLASGELLKRKRKIWCHHLNIWTRRTRLKMFSNLNKSSCLRQMKANTSNFMRLVTSCYSIFKFWLHQQFSIVWPRFFARPPLQQPLIDEVWDWWQLPSELLAAIINTDWPRSLYGNM